MGDPSGPARRGSPVQHHCPGFVQKKMSALEDPAWARNHLLFKTRLARKAGRLARGHVWAFLPFAWLLYCFFVPVCLGTPLQFPSCRIGCFGYNSVYPKKSPQSFKFPLALIFFNLLLMSLPPHCYALDPCLRGRVC